eukprot:scaffold90_cov264-Pinguiococcus_pyrenoidosus.AAC.13
MGSVPTAASALLTASRFDSSMRSFSDLPSWVFTLTRATKPSSSTAETRPTVLRNTPSPTARSRIRTFRPFASHGAAP